MSSRVRDLTCAVILAVAAIWSVAAWESDQVAIGVTLSSGSAQEVRIGDVVPESPAWHAGFLPGSIVTDLTLTDGTTVVQAGRLTNSDSNGELLGTTLFEPRIAAMVALPAPTASMDTSAGHVSVTRPEALERLRSTGWLIIAAALIALVVGAVAKSGRLGTVWAEGWLPIVAALVVPILAVTLRAKGGVAEMAVGGYVLPAIAVLPLAHLLVSHGPNHSRRRTLLLVGSLVVLLVTVWTLARFAGSPSYIDDSVYRYLAMAAVLLAPVLLITLSPRATALQRLDIVGVGLLGCAALVIPALGQSNLVIIVVAIFAVLAVWRGLSVGPLVQAAEQRRRELDLTVAAAEAERARLATDLHDDALQDLTQVIRRFDDLGDDAGSELTREIAQRLRAICSDLRLPLLDSLGAGAALEWLVDRVRPAADGNVELRRMDMDRPPEAVELAVYRVAQEALANAVRHGRSPIVVTYEASKHRARLTVIDAGMGIDAGARAHALETGHFGLAGMRRRADHIGAGLDISMVPEGGTRVVLDWRPSG